MEKTAFITGAGRGIGRQIAIRLAEDGFDCALNDLNENDLAESKALIEALGRKCMVYKADVSSSAEVEEMVKQIHADFGRIDVLVNNAGITRDGLLMRMKEEDWDNVLRINLKSVYNCSKSVSKIMMKQKSGRIISIASVVGIMGNAGQCNYSASKAGIIGFTKSLAKELASRGIRANAVAPGYVQTPMTEKLPQEAKDKLAAQIPLGYLGTPEHIASCVSFLAGKDSEYITGQVISVDGGMAM
ncbi:MAG: 3-oxoacyl-[acyl-carrier-protein] reductase [bacterium]|nr:3-oxoacyl-[acyl-carrier-protein] reductase [bacterium]